VLGLWFLFIECIPHCTRPHAIGYLIFFSIFLEKFLALNEALLVGFLSGNSGLRSLFLLLRRLLLLLLSIVDLHPSRFHENVD
jgi:hypothetical protein